MNKKEEYRKWLIHQRARTRRMSYSQYQDKNSLAHDIYNECLQKFREMYYKK